MSRYFLIALISLVTFSLLGCQSTKKSSQVKGAYQTNWESLATHEKAPEWFRDSKLGIYFHWGPYSVPAFGSEWYPRWMYVEDREGWGKGTFQYHTEKFGHPSEFNYHDFIPMFTAEHFDPVDWAALFKSAGAKFAGPVAQHHDGYAMWHSKVNPMNAGITGPKRDILGDLFKELEQQNLKTIATFHHARTLQRNAHDTSLWAAGTSHFPYHPTYATSTTDPDLRKLYGNMPEKEFYEYWLAEVNEVVDNYSPDIIWFDSWLDKIPEDYRQKMVAYHFNASTKRKKEAVVAYKQEDLPRNIGILDIEQGGMKELSPDYWLTDITLSYNSWCYVQNQRYKPAKLLIQNMIDVWSKKGIVLLNISPRSDGSIPDEQRSLLGELGEWMEANGEAIYGTVGHHTFGYGTAKIHDGHFGGQSATVKYTAEDIRFTASKDKKSLFAFCLGQPESGKEIRLKHVLPAKGGTVSRVSLVKGKTEVAWKMDGEDVLLQVPPSHLTDSIATIFKLELDK